MSDYTYDFTIYTDGSSLRNDEGIWEGGIGFVVLDAAGTIVSEYSAGCIPCPIGKAEAMAAVDSLVFLSRDIGLDGSQKVVVYSDSQYIVNGYTSWMERWAKNSWKNGYTGELRPNYELFEVLYDFKHNHPATIEFKWVPGHSDNKYNDIAHDLATKGRKSLQHA